MGPKTAVTPNRRPRAASEQNLRASIKGGNVRPVFTRKLQGRAHMCLWLAMWQDGNPGSRGPL